ncbi:hypothetical protein ACI48J_07750 [Paenibacillus chitinolyticus]|uniref:hypothetical protein n=1 Tax=Paenibacillus chitinolyticus TaxID=79263 RepID=UPI0038691478
MKALLKEFNEFFDRYLTTWNSCSIDELSAMFSKDLVIGYAYPNNRVTLGTLDDACESWKNSYDYYKDRNPKWHFNIVQVTPVDEDKVMAIFWVSHSSDHILYDKVCMNVETFAKNNGKWSLLRSYSEIAIPMKYVFE